MISGFKGRRGLADLLSFSVMAASAILPVLIPPLLLAQHDERSVRAAYVYNLTKYVTWPPSAGDLNVCVFGGGSTGPAMKLVIDGKVSGGRTIHVLLEPSDPTLSHCDIVYWSDSATSRVRSILDKARGTSILTVGENDEFVRKGGMIGFVRSGDSIQIEVNLDAVNAGGLKVSSRFLDLAMIIHSGKRG